MNILTFDVEDWYQGFKQRGFDGWQGIKSNEKENIRLILDLLDEYDTKATFFVLGNYAENNTDIIKQIYNQGHEIASHSYAHKSVPILSPKEFSEDLRKSDGILSNIIGEKIIGYRAPRWSINESCFWALEILAQQGFKYDSSIFSSSLHAFGNSKLMSTPHILMLKDGSNIIEYPAQVVSLASIKLPIGGGFYFRAAPFILTQLALEHSQKKNNYSMVYLHPYEFDCTIPKIPVSFLFRIIRYHHLNKTEKYLRNLLSVMKFSSCKYFLEKNEYPLNISNLVG